AAGSNVTFDDAVTANGTGAQTFDAEQGTLTANSSITKSTAGTLTLAGDVQINLNGDVDVQNGDLSLEDNTTVASSKTLKASNDVILADGKTLTGTDSLTIEATNGQISAAGIGSTISVTGSSLNLIQNDNLDFADFTFDLQDTTDLTVDVTGGWFKAVPAPDGKNENAADQWKSITATANGDITLSGDGDIITNALNSATGNISVSSENGNLNITEAINHDVVGGPLGGVSLIADNGWVYTTGDPLDPLAHPPVLDVDITGSSDDTTGVETGVDLPAGSGKAAIVIISKQQNLNLGEYATLTANGTYYWQDYDYDDRSSILFLPPPPETYETGQPIDVAIYLGSYDFATPGGSNVNVNCSVDIANNGTMVVDAYDTVNIGDNFENSWSNGQENGLELVSRRTETIDEAMLYNRLPYALEARGNILPSFMDAGLDTYVLRGRVVLAEVLASVGAAPIVAPVGVELEERREMKEEDKDALMGWLIEELGGGNVQMYLARAYQPTLNTDLRPYKAAAKLKDLTEILKDEGGLRVAALVEIVTKSLEKGPVTVEQIRENKAAGQWLDALAAYVSILNTEIGLTADESVNVAMKKYGSGLRPGGEQRVAEWVRRYVKPAGG
ncbi:MAG: DUF4097 domain-containing protein, partial [Sedimentisphaerales bacterium]|nr:DUF4097 domain-containing protein [Sedimentisphaerales bacterium]